MEYVVDVDKVGYQHHPHTSLSMIFVIYFLQNNLNIPVIEPVRSTVTFVESLIKLRLSHSKRTFPKPIFF